MRQRRANDDQEDKLPAGLSNVALDRYVSKRILYQISLCKNIYLSRKNLSHVPQALIKASRLQVIDLSSNELKRFPGQWVHESFPELKKLRLEYNLLQRLEDILELSKCTHLQELSFHENPLRLLNNRLYLLEVLFTSPKPSKAAVRHIPHAKHYSNIAKTPRNEGFPMLQKLNDEWITAPQVQEVESELGRPLLYCSDETDDAIVRFRPIRSGLDTCQRFRTVLEKKRAMNASTFIPMAAPVPKFIGAVESPAGISECPSPTTSELSDNEWNEIQDKLQLGRVIMNPRELGNDHIECSHQTSPPAAATTKGSYLSSFSDLSSQERDSIRIRSKETAKQQLPKTPFENTGVVDCIVQVQRSRKLAENAQASLLSNEVIISDDEYTFNKNDHTIQIGNHKIQLDFHSIIHEKRRENTKRYDEILSASPASLELPVSARGEVEMSLKRLHLRNEIDFAPQIIAPKNEKRYIKALLDSDRAVFEGEAIRQRQREHLSRLEAITNRNRPQTQGNRTRQAKSNLSSWQRRNVRAEEYKSRKPIYSSKSKTIETIESARLDTLPHANSREILLRCAEIRRTAKSDLRDLEAAKHAFVHQELAWEKIRTNKLAVLTRKIQREAEKNSNVKALLGHCPVDYSALMQ